MSTVTTRSKKPSSQESLLKPWAVVRAAGTDDEFVWGEYWYYAEAVRVVAAAGPKRDGEESWDVMKRGENGVLTTEF